MFLKFSQNSQENTRARISFLIKLQASASGGWWLLRYIWPCLNVECGKLLHQIEKFLKFKFRVGIRNAEIEIAQRFS